MTLTEAIVMTVLSCLGKNRQYNIHVVRVYQRLRPLDMTLTEAIVTTVLSCLSKNRQ